MQKYQCEEYGVWLGDAMLAEMMDSITKPALVAIARGKGLMIKQSLRKAEFIEQLSTELLRPDMLRRYLFWMPGVDMYNLLCALGLDGRRLEKYLGEVVRDSKMGNWFCDTSYARYLEMDEDDDYLIELPCDLVAVLRTLLDEEFLVQYEQYLWLQNLLMMGIALYQLIPRDIFLQLLEQWPGCRLSEEDALKAIEMQPFDMDERYMIWGEYIVSSLASPERYSLFLRKGNESYYIPPEEDIRHHVFDTEAAHPIIQGLMRKMTAKWGNLKTNGILDILFMISMTMMLDVSEQKIRELLDKAFEKNGAVEVLWLDVQDYIRSLRPYTRRACNHGFSDHELREREKAAHRARKAAQKAVAKKDNVISIDEQRRKRKKHKKARR